MLLLSHLYLVQQQIFLPMSSKIDPNLPACLPSRLHPGPVHYCFPLDHGSSLLPSSYSCLSPLIPGPQPVPYMQPETGCEHSCPFMSVPCSEPSFSLGKSQSPLHGPWGCMIWLRVPVSNFTSSSLWVTLSQPHRPPRCSEHARHTVLSGPLHLLFPLRAVHFPQMIFTGCRLLQGFVYRSPPQRPSLTTSS